MPDFDDTYRDLLRSIMHASYDSTRWIEVLQRLHSDYGGIKTQLIITDTSSENVFSLLQYGYDSSAIASYFDHFHAVNPWTPSYDRLATGAVFSSDMLIDYSALKRTEFYGDWLHPQGNIFAGGGVLIQHTPQRKVFFGGNLQERYLGHHHHAWLTMLQHLTPVFDDALNINRLQAALMVPQLGGQGAPSIALFNISRTGHVQFANDAAAGVLRGQERFVTLYRGALLFRDLHAQAWLEACLSRSAQLRMDAQTLPVLRWQGWELRLYPTQALREFGPSNWPHLGGGQSLALTLQPVLQPTSAPAKLRAVYPDVTAAEAEVVIAFAQGADLDAIAAPRGSRRVTVSNQIKSAMQKMGARRATALIAQVLAILNADTKT